MSAEKMMLRLKIDTHRIAVRQFVAMKGRMPKDQDELGVWLMEFTEELGQLLSRWQDAVMDRELLKTVKAGT